MAEEIHDEYSVKCRVCGKKFEIVWGEDNELCETCKAEWEKMK